MTTVYDPATLLTSSVSVPGLLDTTYGYDERGRLKSVKTGTRETLFDYDTGGNLDFITDPENHTTYFDYDKTGRVKEIRRPDMTDLYIDYDANGNMEILTVPKPEDRTVDHSFGYNNVNLESSYTTPMNKGYGYTYDRDRRLTKKTFPSGDEINYVYEPGKDRLEQIQTPEGNTDYTYYPCGVNVETVSRGGETVTYEYDGSLVTGETFAGTLNLSLGYKYNSDFDIEEFTYAGNTETYAYDDDGLLTGAGNFTVARKPENGLPEAVTGGSLNLARTFSGYGETESENYAVNSQGKYSWSVTRDDNGKIRRKTETAEGVTSVYVYDYDPAGRLLTVKDGNDTLLEEYRYDPNGTRNYEMNTRRGIAGRSLTYHDDDCLMSAGDALYEYDSDGFLEKKTDASGETLYDYSSRGELLSVTLPDSTFIEYSHDPLGRRIEKKINDAVVEKYLWQGRTRLLAVYDGSGILKMRFEYAEGRMPAAMSTNDSSVYYLTYDQVGSLRIVTDVSGTVVKKIDYDSFGNIISPDTNPAFEIPFGFAGGSA
ncbi:MAG: RHS repeat protein [Desulfobacteraceae bacterium]|nr:RHS repeat protein [Desulfobacteraceae bacterium]